MTNYDVRLDQITRRHASRRQKDSPCHIKESIDRLDLPQLYSPSEAGAYLGISTDAVLRRLKTGDLPGKKHGRRWCIRAIDLAAYVEPNNGTQDC